jgi:L-amino acid N-acyltransferase YncA
MITYATAETEEDLRGILVLQKANLKTNLSKEEVERDGFVTVDHTFGTLKKLHDIAPHIIAKDNSKVVGYVLAMTKKSRFDIPIIFPMFAEFEKIPFKGKMVSDYNYMVVGQACIHKDYRGKGLVEKCFQKYKETFAERYDFSITEIAVSNKRSLYAHRKVGYEQVHTYTDPEGNEWGVVLWDWNKEIN